MGSSSIWRFINSGFHNGAYNMATDMAITQKVAAGNSPPTLRVYGWRPAAISLGHFQSENDIDLELCKQDGIDIVFRPTGGRAILHLNEITYSVSIPPSNKYYSSDINNVYRQISLCLVRSLKLLDIPVEFERAKKSVKKFSNDLSSLCYATSIQYEIAINGKKLVGSAQRRIAGGVLQHGSILMGIEHLNITKYLKKGDDRSKDAIYQYMKENTISLDQVTSKKLDYNLLSLCLKDGFSQELNVEFEDSEITDEELKTSKELLAKFSLFSCSSGH